MAKTGPSAGSWRIDLPTPKHPISPNRYHLYVGLFCPFAHRVLLTREFKGLQAALPLSIVKPYPKADGGWRFPSSDSEYPGSTVDHLFGSTFLHEVYFRSPPSYKEYEGRYTVPVLWDKEEGSIVNNESEDLMRVLNHAFDELIEEDEKRRLDFYPEDLRPAIDEFNGWLVSGLNIGVYRAGFAPDQETYNTACVVVFETLDRLECVLKDHDGPFVLGQRMTELDFKAYASLIRFDAIYVQHFKLNVRTIRHDYPYLHRYLKNLYWNEKGFKETTNFKHIKENYSKSHADVNPKAITPMGPIPDIEAWTEDDERWRSGWPKSTS